MSGGKGKSHGGKAGPKAGEGRTQMSHSAKAGLQVSSKFNSILSYPFSLVNNASNAGYHGWSVAWLGWLLGWAARWDRLLCLSVGLRYHSYHDFTQQTRSKQEGYEILKFRRQNNVSRQNPTYTIKI